MSERPWHTFDGEGRCIAWLHDLPVGSVYFINDNGHRWERGTRSFPNRPVHVVAWPDGSPPEAPARDFRIEFGVDDAELRWQGHHQAFVSKEVGEALLAALSAASVIRQEVKP